MLLWPRSGAAAPVPVRFAEGIVRGFLVLNSSEGALLASGDFLQVKRGAEVETRTVFYFKDGSLFDETVVFTQQPTFTMQSYRLVQKGPAFSQDMKASLDRASGKYRVQIKDHKDGREKVHEGKLDMPPDLYNGMVPIIAKNLRAGAGESIHMVAFTPAPRLIGLDLAPTGENKVLVGGLTKAVVHYVLKPRLSLGLKIPAALLGRLPPDNHLWIMTAEVPAFIRFEGPLYPEGPVWQIELTSPRWVK
ncbi:MAG TPA: hypothetical protein VIK40_10390 [Geomonas sp.]